MPDHGDNQETPAPVTAPGRPRSNRDWWPNQPDLRMLRQPAPQSSPLDGGYSYREQFKTLDVEALKRDVIAVMTSPQDWWAADYGHYGPLFIRMTWHAAGTYRIRDGRGGEGGRPALRTPQQLAGQREPG